VRPKVYTIPSWEPFLASFVDGILDRYWRPEDPLRFSDITILLPTRRAVRAIHDVFARAIAARGAGGVVLPALRPIGDIDEDELEFSEPDFPDPAASLETVQSAIPEYKRLFLLSGLIRTWFQAEERQSGISHSANEAFAYALELARFLDAAQTDKVDLARLRTVVADRFSEHWQQTLVFLNLLEEHWPKILASLGMIDPAERRNRLIERYADYLAKGPCDKTVIAAGSTGSIDATAELLRVVAHLPHGAVVLPGLDQTMDEAAWAQVDIQHPQYGLKDLIGRIGIERACVSMWRGSEQAGGRPEIEARGKLLSEALKPALATDTWRDAVERFDAQGWRRGLEGLSILQSRDEQEEAGVIALLLREAYEQPGKTAVLVTPDRGLARRVIANLKRWNISIDDSAGRPFLQTWRGMFLHQIIDCAASGFRPALLLNVLKHPLCRLGRSRTRGRRLVARLDVSYFRRLGARVDWAAMKAQVHNQAEAESERSRSAVRDNRDLLEFIDDLEEAFAPLYGFPQNPATVADYAAAHARVAEALAAPAGAEEGEREGAPLWGDDAGEAAAGLMRDLCEHGADLTGISLDSYREIFAALAARIAVRKRFGITERLAIWGPLEARLQKADLIILGSLNENNWPSTPRIDPWANRPMRSAIGMQLPERKIGLSAHDFSQLAMNGEVVLSRAVRSGGAPTVPARWLLRLQAILKGADCYDQAIAPGRYAEWWAALDRACEYRPEPPPAPCPPVKVRPRRFSVSDVATWVRDPYAIYARKILDLKPLDDLEQAPDAAVFGTLVHDILCTYVKSRKADTSADERHALMRGLIDSRLDPFADWPQIKAIWAIRLLRICDWFVGFDEPYLHLQSWVETQGEISWPAAFAPVAVRARADRIVSTGTGLEIIDYKTGSVAAKKQVWTQLEPQLPLEALIARDGGFEGVPAAPVVALSYVGVSGKPTETGRRVIAEDAADTETLLADTKAGFLNWVAQFDRESTPYRSRPRVQYTYLYADYDHLARVKEWSAVGHEGADHG